MSSQVYQVAHPEETTDVSESALANGAGSRKTQKKRAKRAGEQENSRREDRFRFDRDIGVYARVQTHKESKEVWVCSPLIVTASFRSLESDDWGCIVEFSDPDGKIHELPIFMQQLHTDFNTTLGAFVRRGLRLSSSRTARELVTEYIQSRRPKKRIRCATNVGWLGTAYVFSDESFQPKDAEPVRFLGAAETAFLTNQDGSLEDWQRNVAQKCSGNSRLVFAVSTAFAPPLLALLEEEGGGLHFHGATSTGKTTAQKVAGSVWGGGPVTGYLHSWRSTANGLESIAQLHNDGLLCLDEISQIDPREAGEVAYMLANGHGKLRMTKTLHLDRQPTWRVLFLSGGETTLAQHVESTGRKTLGGQRVRLLDVPADANAGLGIFEDLHGSTSADAFSRELRGAALRFYGTPIRAFANTLVAERAEQLARVRATYEEFRRERIPASASGEVFRAGGRFALIAAAGELATTLGITGWAEGEAYGAAVRCFADWMHSRGTAGSSDEEAAVHQVLDFIQRHGASRFVRRADENERPVINRAGFIQTHEKTQRRLYLIFPDVFKRDVCSGYDPEFVAKALRKRGMLATQKGAHLSVTRDLPGIGKTRVYAVALHEEVTP